jgi:uncharacterized membrane protein
MRRHARKGVPAKSMRGSIALMAALWLTVAITMLGVLDVSHVWWQRRTLQGVADMAALAGAQRLEDSCGAAAPQTIIRKNATANGYDGALTVTCGRYNLNAKSLVANATPYNAVNVALNDDVKYWFIPSFGPAGPTKVNVAVQATSRVTNVAAFTLGTGLATVRSGNSALLNGLLTGLLGSKSQINLDLLTYQTLAGTQIRLGDLALALQAKDVTDLLTNPPPTMAALIAALSTVAAKTSSVASAVLSALLSKTSSGIAGTPVNLNDSGSTAGMFNIGLGNKNGAFDVTVNALDALLVAAEIANSGPTATPIKLQLLTLIAPDARNPAVSGGVSIRINEPPVLAAGEATQDASGHWLTVAHSAQISVLLELSVNVIGIDLDLPLYVGVAPGKAELTATQCGAGHSDSGSFMTVTPGIANMCLGGQAPAIFAAGPNALVPDCTPASNIVSAGGLITIAAAADMELRPTPKNIAFTGAGHKIAEPNPVTVTSNDLGADLTSALTTLIHSLLGTFKITILGLDLGLGWLQGLLDPVLDLVANIVSPLLTTLVPPLLDLLGVQVGTSTVTDLSLTCGNVQLVE